MQACMAFVQSLDKISMNLTSPIAREYQYKIAKIFLKISS
jgi:hypothetical protein